MVKQNMIVAFAVGTALNAINQGDALLSGGAVSVTKLALTYCIPFCVATFGAYNSLLSQGDRIEK